MAARIRDRWADMPLRGKMLLVVAIPTAALLLTAAIFGFAQQAERAASDEVSRSLDVRRRIISIRTVLRDAESGVRGYLLTGNEEWLAPYDGVGATVASDLAELRALSVENAGQVSRIDALEPLVQRRLAILEQARASQPITGGQSAELQQLLGQGHEAMARAARVLDDLDAAQEAVLAENRRDLDTVRSRGTLLVAATLVLGAIGTVLATSLLTSGVVRRLRLAREGAARLAAGQPLEGLPQGGDEVGQLGAALREARSLLVDRERALDEARSFLEQLIETGPVLMMRLTVPRANTQYVSPNVTKLLGYDPRDVVADGWWRDHLHPDDIERVRAGIRTAIANRAPSWETEWRFVRADGTPVWVDAKVIPEYDEAGAAPTMLVYALDVTPRKFAEAARDRTERELRAAVAELDDLYNNSPCGYHSLDGEGRIIRINDTELRWLGYTREEVVGKLHFTDLLTPAGIETFRSTFPAFKERGFITDLPYEFVRKDGRLLPVEISATAVHDADGRYLASRSTVIDATTRREVEQAREAARRAAEAAREAAEAANRAKSEFLSRMSHELRTPLNAILGFSQLLQLDELPAEQAESVSFIESAGRHLLELINEILDISRIEAGSMTLSPEPVAVADLLSELVALVAPLAGGRRISVERSPAGCEGYVLADRQRLKQVLLNLLSNAVKYNRDGGRITVTCEKRQEDRLRILVADTGHGIAPELMDRLFKPFDRLGAEGGAIEGTGMGLALSKGLVEAMGGSVGAESVLDAGSTFWVELATAEGPLERLARTPPPAAERRNGTRRTILQIDDNLPNVRLVEQILAKRDSHELIPAMQGRLGLDLARQHRPDLVLLDVHLPDMNGLDVLRLLKTWPETRDIPVVVLSADATKSQTARFMGGGAAGYLTKPIDVSEFLSLLDRMLDAPVPA